MDVPFSRETADGVVGLGQSLVGQSGISIWNLQPGLSEPSAWSGLLACIC